MGRRPFIFTLLLCSLAALARGDADDGPPPTSFRLSFAGYVKGSGTGQLTGNTLSISGEVQDEAGNKGNFSASGLTIDAKSHFTGTGTVLGVAAKVGGRLDTPAASDKQLRTRGLVATFSTAGPHYGRIAGFLPPPPGPDRHDR